MDIREVYNEAVGQGFESLSLLIEFLVLEKQVLTWDSEYKELDRYLASRNHKRMNQLLIEYREGNQ